MKKIKKILFLVDYFFPYSKGGIESWLSALINKLEMRNYDVKVITNYNLIDKIYSHFKRNPLKFKYNVNPKALIRIPIINFRFSNVYNLSSHLMSSFLILLKLIQMHIFKKLKNTILIAINPGWACLSLQLMKRLFKTEYNIFFHSYWSQEFGMEYPTILKLISNIEKLNITYSNKISVHGEDVYEYYTKKYGKIFSDKAIIMHLAVDTKKFNPICKSAPDLIKLKEMNYKILLCVTSLRPIIKGIENAIHSMRYVAKELEKIKLIVVGSGNQKYFEDLTQKMKIGNSILFLGERNDVQNLMVASNILIVPGSHEAAFPTVILEAMASRLVVLATKHAAIDKVVFDRETGFLVEPNNPSKLAEQIINILSFNERDLERIKDNAQRLTNMNYNWDIRIKEILNFIQ